MSTLTEIEAALPKLTPEELMRLEAAIRKLQRERKAGIIFDDAYGVWTEDEQASLATEAVQALDGGTQTPVATKDTLDTLIGAFAGPHEATGRNSEEILYGKGA